MRVGTEVGGATAATGEGAGDPEAGRSGDENGFGAGSSVGEAAAVGGACSGGGLSRLQPEAITRTSAHAAGRTR
jgi:hypothetical protein